MGGVRRLEHAVIRVKNLEQSLRIFTSGMGLAEIARNNGAVYLGCGLDKNFDIGIIGGGSGLDHFAMRCDSEQELESYRNRLKQNGVEYETVEKLDPGEKAAIRCKTPSGTAVEFVTVSDNSYQRDNVQALMSRLAIAPQDADHVNIMTPDVPKETEFFVKVLGFRLSVVQTNDRGDWSITYVRQEDWQHDIAINSNIHDIPPEQLESNKKMRLHHVAWTTTSIEHMKLLVDQISSMGVPMEYGPARQRVGNISTYYWEPGGNRMEFSTEMPTLDSNFPTRIEKLSEGRAFGWGIRPPLETFRKGS